MDAHHNGVAREWRMLDALWARIEPLLPKLPRRPQAGRPWIDSRKIANGLFYVLRTGCQFYVLRPAVSSTYCGPAASFTCCDRLSVLRTADRLSVLRAATGCQFYVLRIGCQFHVLLVGRQWKAGPREFGSGSTRHRRFQQWVQRGVFRRLWQAGLLEDDGSKGIQWQS